MCDSPETDLPRRTIILATSGEGTRNGHHVAVHHHGGEDEDDTDDHHQSE